VGISLFYVGKSGLSRLSHLSNIPSQKTKSIQYTYRDGGKTHTGYVDKVIEKKDDYNLLDNLIVFLNRIYLKVFNKKDSYFTPAKYVNGKRFSLSLDPVIIDTQSQDDGYLEFYRSAAYIIGDGFQAYENLNDAVKSSIEQKIGLRTGNGFVALNTKL
jgi:hypothetical protein